MKHKIFLIPLTGLALCGCTFTNMDNNPGDPGTNDPGSIVSKPVIDDSTSGEEIEVKVDTTDEDVEIESQEPEEIVEADEEVDSSEANVIKITKAGSYEFSGEYEGNIIVDAGDDDEVELVLNGFSIKSSSNSPILCWNADKLEIKLQKGSKNYIYDTRENKVEDDETQGNGAIYSKCDTEIKGKGSLFVTARYNNGIHSTKDLTMSSKVNDGSSVQINAYNNAIKGNNSLTIESGNIVAISTGGNAIKTEDSDLTKKGKQKGTITIKGGQLDIYSCKDGIEASYDAVITSSTDEDTKEVVEPTIHIYTSNYSKYSGDVVETSESKLYLRTDYYDTSSWFAVSFKSDTDVVTTNKATYVKSLQSNRKTYYYYEVDKPNTAQMLKVYSFDNSVTDFDESKAKLSMTNYENINNYYDTACISKYSSSLAVSSWTSYSTSTQQGGGYQPGGPGGGPGGQGGMSEGNTNKSDYSSKGIKANNQITIDAGKIYVKAYDDAIHANYGETLGNGETGIGDVTISGGNFELYASDDAIHADRNLNISGGSIDIIASYEGIEGNVINISGGYTKVYATDDGLNAANKANISPSINISGGVTDITVYGGDVDGIDSNGTFTQSGGVVITKGASGGMSTGLDCDGTAKITAGSFICFGKPEKTPTKSGSVSSYNLSGSYSAGTYKVTCGENVYETTTKYSYSTVTVYSDQTNKITVEKK